MAGATFKHQVNFTLTGTTATLRLPAAYDVIQFQLHNTGTPAAGDLLLIEGIDEDGATIAFPGGGGAGAQFLLSADKVLQFSWKGPAVKLTYTEADLTSCLVKVKSFMEGAGDVDTGSAYPTALAPHTNPILGDGVNPTRSLRG